MSIIQLRQLGHEGRFGNQLFQYLFARGYAKRINATLEVPADWVGRQIFQLNHPPISKELPDYAFDAIPNGESNLNLRGYYQNVSALNYYSKSEAQRWLAVKAKWLKKYPKKYPIVAHLRRGDYVDLSHVYCIVTEVSYNTCVSDYNLPYWFSYIEEGRSNSIIDPEIPFLPDFLAFMNAEILMRSNSSFSWMAALLSNGKVYSPVVGNLIGVQDVKFVDGNHPMLVHPDNVTGPHKNFTDLWIKE